eukprot:3353503-Pyramimonas_sp.AAC.1
MNHIANSFGERLVYKQLPRYAGRPLADRYGTLSWMKEPDEGWKIWEEEKSPDDPKSTTRYAD